MTPARRTIARSLAFEGRTLHGGARGAVALAPAAAGTGWTLNGWPRATWTHNDAPLATRVVTPSGRVSTVEHLWAALALVDVDDVHVTVDGPEVPILDGSAWPYFQALEGSTCDSAPVTPRAPWRWDWPSVALDVGAAHLTARPRSDSTWPLLEVASSWPGVAGGRLVVDLSVAETRARLARARTFGRASTLPRLRAGGRALGADATCCVGLTDAGDALPETPLRFDAEPLWHKALDLVGDLAWLPGPRAVCVTARDAGHAANGRLARALLDRVGAT
jgi:UDP-3-O-[3-hydroxymyristoyl] N-acetylglucosamine deacetylase